jgi:carboxylesterase
MSRTAQDLIRRSADPAAYDLTGGQDDTGVLLIHGFTASATETRPLADFIRQRTGWRCKGILLPGHGTTVEEMERTTAEEWLREAEAGYAALAKDCSRVFLAGVSMGAVLCCHVALNHAAESRLCGLVLMAPGFGLDPLVEAGARLLSYVKRFEKKGAATERYFIEKKLFSYTHVPLKKIHELTTLGRQAVASLDNLKHIPMLMLAGTLDRTVSLARIRSAAKQHPWIRYVELPNSRHILTVEPDHQAAFEESVSFIQSCKARMR